MKIELVNDWEASCEIEFEFKGHTLKGYWGTEEGHRVLDWGDSDFSDDDRDELERLLQDAETPVLRFSDGSDFLEV
jgi:hypothetical protein